jgi:hypothetical protein
MVVPLPASIDQNRLWNWAFDLPFPEPRPASEHPFHATVHQHTLAWLTRLGIVHDERTKAQHVRHDLPSWGLFCYPNAPLDSLKLIGDFASWWGFCDEILSDPDHRGRGADLYVAPLAIVKGEKPGPVDSQYQPFVNGWQDIWSRWCQGMSEPWIRQTSEHLRATFQGFIDEDRDLCDGVALNVDQLQLSRDQTGVNYAILDLIERADKYVLPPLVARTETMQSMQFRAARELWLTQDLQSLHKEEDAGDVNIVLTLEREQGVDRLGACGIVHRMIREHTDGFLRDEAAMPRVMDDLGLSPEARIPVYRYIAGMREVMAGTVAFCAASGRYRQSAGLQALAVVN